MNHYEILGIAPDSSEKEIKDAYRKEAMKWHPDRHETPQEKAEAERRFKLLAEAYRVLRDKQLRSQYDSTLRGDSSATQAKSQPEQEDANAIFFEQMLDLAFDLASRGFPPNKIASALTSLGCPESMAKAVANLANKRNGERQDRKTARPTESNRASASNLFETKRELYKAAIGERGQKYYLAKFEEFDNQTGKKRLSLNIAAFLFQAFWLIHRGMWKYAGMYLIGSLLVGLVFAALPETAISEQTANYVSLGIGVLFSLAANKLYYKHVNRLISIAAAKTPSLEEQTSFIKKKDRKATRYALAALAVIFLVGITAAVALPAYQDYTRRAMTLSALSSAQEAAKYIDQYVQRNKRTPLSLQEAGYTPQSSDDIEAIEYHESINLIEVKFTNDLTNGTLYFVGNNTSGSTVWLCGSESLPAKVLPVHCRETQTAASAARSQNIRDHQMVTDKVNAILRSYPELDDQHASHSEKNAQWFFQKYMAYVASGESKMFALVAAEMDYRRAIQASPTDAQTKSTQRVNLNFDNIDFQALLRVLSDISKVKLVADDSIRFSTSVSVQDTPWEILLLDLLKQNHLAFLKGRSGYYIYPMSISQGSAAQRAAARGFE